jgi:hypothetical protein
MKRIYLLPVLAATFAATALPAVAQAQQPSDPAAKAQFLGKIKATGNKATLKVTYNCDHGQTLWISAKQSANAKKDARLQKEGSSKVAKTWFQSHRNKITCDGAKHTASFTLDKVEPGSKGKLKKGVAYVQFCVTAGETDLVLSSSGWVGVRRS